METDGNVSTFIGAYKGRDRNDEREKLPDNLYLPMYIGSVTIFEEYALQTTLEHCQQEICQQLSKELKVKSLLFRSSYFNFVELKKLIGKTILKVFQKYYKI